MGGWGSWICGNPRSPGVKFAFRWVTMLDWDGRLSQQKATIPLSDVLVCLCPSLVCRGERLLLPAVSLPFRSPPRHGAPAKTLAGPQCWVHSLIAVWMLILGRCTGTLIPARKSVFQSRSGVTESSESLRSLRHNLSVFESPLKIAASIFSDRVIICLLRNRRFCNTHLLSN